MDNFDLEANLRTFYDQFPEGKKQPVIGITTDYSYPDATIRSPYYEQVVEAGATPVLLPPVTDHDVLVNTLDHIDGLILTGGGDHNPLWWGEEPQPSLHHINRDRDLAELLLARLAFNRQIPMLGICRGIQTLAIALGGRVCQDIASSRGAGAPPLIKHSQDASRREPTHSVNIAKESVLAKIFGRDRLFVNSFHHQAVDSAGSKFRVAATAPDGVIEAIESSEYKPVIGVQWHPEWLGADGQPLFRWLKEQAELFAKAKALHQRVLTLDTHCDTPMFFPQGVDFFHRDNRILYDMHKMTEGHIDAVTMVAYLPQPKMGERFSAKVDLAGIARHNPELARKYGISDAGGQSPTLSPTAYADLIFDKIESIVASKPEAVSIARTPQDLYEDKRLGRKSIMLGIENGLALGHDISAVRHFAQRGVVYITLCHNGDNDICDSARQSCATNGGVSPFGSRVIEEMCRQGIMVDLSHAAEQSFYDALDISPKPIVCSHSCCRALCDVPRNLSDDQMRALARKRGVAHITLYHGFLRQSGEATILDVMAHLQHAVNVMGIDHVGLGTDFDGDGTVRGMADASELINFTLALMRRHYSEQEIAMLWGGNWLRVMAEVQRSSQSNTEVK